jgi:hypothetical protein
MNERLTREFDYYLAHQQELARQYSGKFLVIKGQTVIGVFDSELEAVQKTSKSHELGTFLVQKCEASDQSHTQTFHSRVSFA